MAELLTSDPQVLRDVGLSARKGATLRALAERFVDGRWRPYRSLAVSYLFASEYDA